MRNKTLAALCGLALLGTLVACDRGQGANDTLVDGAVDEPTGGNTRAAAEDVGPPTAPSTAAGPAAARTGAAGQAGATPAAPAAGGATLTLAQGAHGGHLTDAAGVTVYHLEGDRDGSKCTGDCLVAWPPVLITDVQPTGATGLQGAMIATIQRPDGTTQVTYNGMPLYRYAGDAGAGSTNGHGVKDKYGTWYLVSAQGTAVPKGAHAGH